MRRHALNCSACYRGCVQAIRSSSNSVGISWRNWSLCTNLHLKGLNVAMAIQPSIGSGIELLSDYFFLEEFSAVLFLFYQIFNASHCSSWSWPEFICELIILYCSTCKCVNVTDTISWQGHHDRVMQLNWLYFCGICQLMPLKLTWSPPEAQFNSCWFHVNVIFFAVISHNFHVCLLFISCVYSWFQSIYSISVRLCLPQCIGTVSKLESSNFVSWNFVGRLRTWLDRAETLQVGLGLDRTFCKWFLGTPGKLQWRVYYSKKCKSSIYSLSFRDTELKLCRYVEDSIEHVIDGSAILGNPGTVSNTGLITPHKGLIISK